jgi:uncharacterized membrane protein YqjE
VNDNPSAPPGLVDSLRTLADGLLASVRDRVALVGIELQEEKLRLVQMLVWTGAVIVTGLVALVAVSGTLVYLFWDTARTAVVVGLSFLHAALFVSVLFGFRRMLAQQRLPFAASLDEIVEDRRCLGKGN